MLKNGELVQEKEKNLLAFLPLKEKEFSPIWLEPESWNLNTISIVHLPVFHYFIVLALERLLTEENDRFSRHGYEKKIVFLDGNEAKSPFWSNFSKDVIK